MANMSYCRFENTYHDLQDCLEALANEGMDSLSESEKKYAKKLIDTCTEIAQDFDESIDEIVFVD